VTSSQGGEEKINRDAPTDNPHAGHTAPAATATAAPAATATAPAPKPSAAPKPKK
jgi:hypothetical protein